VGKIPAGANGAAGKRKKKGRGEVRRGREKQKKRHSLQSAAKTPGNLQRELGGTKVARKACGERFWRKGKESPLKGIHARFRKKRI